ncbi:hypothetical protein GCM10007886_37150 [Methylobacterium gregans]|nr:hypothetical protein [Methylobacterium gregans]GLS55530.1 hypothetical protein GCM10007886_37150 [Methylobacterium gregans]
MPARGTNKGRPDENGGLQQMTRIAIRVGHARVTIGLGLAGLVACLGAADAAAQESKTAPAPPTAAAAPVKLGCDAACTRQAVPAAIQACAPSIERQAPSDFEWMSRPAGTIFQQAEPPTGSDTVARFRGDSIRFLSPQGQWVRVTYECDYDTAAQTVRNVKVRLGRIDGKGANEGAAVRPGAGGNQAAAPATPAQPKRLRPGEPSEVEIRQVSPGAR